MATIYQVAASSVTKAKVKKKFAVVNAIVAPKTTGQIFPRGKS